MQQVFEILNWIAANVPWEAVAASGILSGLLVGPQKLIAKWFKHNEIVIISFIGIVVPTLTFAWTYLIHQYPTDPNIVALQGLAIAFMTQPFYYIMVKPISRKVSAWFAGRVAEAALLNEAKATLVPSVPVAPVVISDIAVPTALSQSIDEQHFDR